MVSNSSFVLSPVPTHRSLTEDVIPRLREAILNGHFGPGERLRENLLAQSMQVSRGPVREALRQLEREGLVVMQPQRGACVARLSRTDLDEVYSLRLALERLAVQEAVRHIEPPLLAELQAVVDLMNNKAVNGVTEQEAAEIDMRFHEILYKASKHQRLFECWTNLKPQIHIFLLSRTVVSLDFQEAIVRGHQDIVHALAARDEKIAVALIEDHIQTSYKRIVSIYEAAHNT